MRGGLSRAEKAEIGRARQQAARALLEQKQAAMAAGQPVEAKSGLAFYSAEFAKKTGSLAISDEARADATIMLEGFRTFQDGRPHTVELSEDVVPLDRILEMGAVVSLPHKGFMVLDSFVAVASGRATERAQLDMRHFKKASNGLFLLQGREPSDSQQQRLSELQDAVSRLNIPRMAVLVTTTYREHDDSLQLENQIRGEVPVDLGHPTLLPDQSGSAI